MTTLAIKISVGITPRDLNLLFQVVHRVVLTFCDAKFDVDDFGADAI
jgi:hypothetical protein